MRARKDLIPRSRILFVFIVTFAIVLVWIHRHGVDSDDAISYLDIAGLYSKGDWRHAINSYWSPLYSLLIALFFKVLRPAADQEFQGLRALSGAVFIAGWFCFHSLIRTMLKVARNRSPGACDSARERWVELIGFAGYLWAGLFWLPPPLTTPDGLVGLFFYLSCRQALLLGSGLAPGKSFPGLGIWIGLGYLAKASFLPVGLILFLGSFLRHPSKLKEKLPWATAGLLVLGVICGSWILPNSLQKGRLIWGEAGRLNYEWHVSPCRGRMPAWRYWQGECREAGVPLHSAKIFSLRPLIRDSSGVFPAVSDPAWFDPSYWYDGLQMTFGWKDQLSIATGNFRFYARKFLIAISILALGLRWIQIRRKAAFDPCLMTSGDGTSPLWIAAATGLILHAFCIDLLASFEPMRYVAPFVIVMLVLLAMRLSPPLRSPLGFKIAYLFAPPIVGLTLFGAFGNERKAGAPAIGAGPPLSEWIAQTSREAGLLPGDAVLTFDNLLPESRYAARLTVTHTGWDADTFLHMIPWEQKLLHDDLRHAGVKGILLDETEFHRGEMIQEFRWYPVRNSKFSVIRL